MRKSNRRRSAEASARTRTRAAAGAACRAIRLASLAALALGLTLAASAPAEAQKKRLSMNVKIGANTLHTPVYGSVQAGHERRGDLTDVLGWVDMPPQRQFKVKGRCKFSRGGIAVQRLAPNALTLPAGFLDRNSPDGSGSTSGSEAWSSLRRGTFEADFTHRTEQDAGQVEALTWIQHHPRSPRKALIHMGGMAATNVARVAARSSRADFTTGLGPGAGLQARRPEGRQVLVEVVNRGSKPAYLRLRGLVVGGISELFRYTTNASARIGYMRLRCGTPYGKGKAKVLVQGGAPDDDGQVSRTFDRTNAAQMRIGRGRHQVWLETMARGGAVGVNIPEDQVVHDSIGDAVANLQVCLRKRRGGRCRVTYIPATGASASPTPRPTR